MTITEVRAGVGGKHVKSPLRKRVFGAFGIANCFTGGNERVESRASQRVESRASQTSGSGELSAKNPRKRNGDVQKQKSNISPRPTKVANYELPPPLPPTRNFTSRRIGQTHGAPVSGELGKSARINRSGSKKSVSLSKLRDQYITLMLKLGESSKSISIGNSVHVESQVFESEVIRKRSQAENDILDVYLHSSIQPGEWQDAHMGSRIMGNSGSRSRI